MVRRACICPPQPGRWSLTSCSPNRGKLRGHVLGPSATHLTFVMLLADQTEPGGGHHLLAGKEPACRRVCQIDDGVVAFQKWRMRAQRKMTEALQFHYIRISDAVGRTRRSAKKLLCKKPAEFLHGQDRDPAAWSYLLEPLQERQGLNSIAHACGLNGEDYFHGLLGFNRIGLKYMQP